MKLKIDKQLLIIMFIFIIFGLIMVLSSSSMASFMRYNNDIYKYFLNQGIFDIMGLIIFFGIIFFLPTSFFKKISPFTMGVIIILLIGLFFFGEEINGTKGWYDLKLFMFQPGEFSKIGIITYLAYYYNKNKKKLDDLTVLYIPLIICIFIFLLIALQPDLGTAVINALIVVLIFYSLPLKKEIKQTINKRNIITLIAICLLLFSGVSMLKDYQLKRFDFLNPCEKYESKTGYQLCNSLIAYNNGGLLGKGIGESTQKYLYLPESHTDFIFPIIVEELGLITGIIVILLYLYMLFRILIIAKNANNLGNSIIAYGIFSYYLIHISINLIGVLGIGPLTGVPLPFLSYGGSHTIASFIAMGLVQRVCYESNKKNNVNRV